MRKLNISKVSVASYLPYEKGVYFRAETDSANLSVDAERIRRMRKRNKVFSIPSQFFPEFLQGCLSLGGNRFDPFAASGIPKLKYKAYQFIRINKRKDS